VQLGYPTLLLIDSDKLPQLKISVREMEQQGVVVVRWDNEMSTEQRIAADLSWEALKQFVSLASQRIGEDSTYDQVCLRLGKTRAEIGIDIDVWKTEHFSELQVRNAIGGAAKECDWFKRIDLGEELGKLVSRDWANLADKDLALKLTQLQNWVYE
jgi:hypothetical protein